ncbi:phosphatidylglycerophosphatase A family protein [Gorillibacterium sp. sgz500922]|uniref:phosphatidylglycerophosphatase A family protein n=1 Tax=Gorillibacterium sp. sgz500922 TaxID=3446694 RepID=UPI003F677DF7
MRVHSREVEQAVYRKLEERGVELKDIADIVLEMQLPYHPNLQLAVCLDSVRAVLAKRELQHAILVGVELDVLAEQNGLSEPLLSILREDEGLFGCDETLAIGSVYGYGSIALTTFGFLDKQKIGIIRELDNKSSGKINTFLDDLVAAIASSASSRIAHKQRDLEEKPRDEAAILEGPALQEGENAAASEPARRESGEDAAS